MLGTLCATTSREERCLLDWVADRRVDLAFNTLGCAKIALLMAVKVVCAHVLVTRRHEMRKRVLDCTLVYHGAAAIVADAKMRCSCTLI